MQDDALFHASLKVLSSAFSGIGLGLIGETPLQNKYYICDTSSCSYCFSGGGGTN
jgi:hypothetical protein